MSDLEGNKRTVIEFFDLVFNQKRLDELEHWDVVQEIPAAAVNDNGMF